MATKPISTPLPADLPDNWTTGQTVAPTGAEVGLSEQHGYNYLMEQVNAAQEAANTINDAFEDLPTIEDVTPSAIGALLAIAAAAAYSPSSTYSEGDYCTYQGQLYKANQDISTAEPWTAAHWTATSIMAELDALDYDPSGTATTVVNEHNTNPYAHPSIQAAMLTASIQVTYNGGGN